MSSLYRKYRPNQFADVVGQEHIISSIEGMLKSDQIGHAYLFSGPRGTGKTSLARLLARAVNCVGQKTGIEACGQCAICQEIERGQSTDIFEIDAASNRGIDEIRDLREKIAFAPTRSKYKVYIIDEVHMLTKEAFNALLKTIEEPPPHAIFILATTELHKVPETIISRCLRYQFHRAEPDKIATILRQVSVKEGLKLDEEAIRLLAARSEGSYRDALSLLGNLSGQTELKGETVRAMIGLPSQEAIDQLQSAIQTGQAKTVAKLLKDFLSQGMDIAVLVRALANQLREQIFDATGGENVNQTAPLLEELLLSLVKSRHSTDSTTLLVSALISLSLKREKAATVVAEPATAGPASDITPSTTPAVPVVDAVTATPVKVTSDDQFWPVFLESVKEKNHALYAIIRSAQFEGLSDGKLIVAVKFRFYSERLFEPKNRNLVESLATKIAGEPIVLECQVKADLDVLPNKEEDLLSAVVEVFEINE